MQCARQLSLKRKDMSFERTCCRVPLHRHCIGNAKMERCPSCQKCADLTESPFLWIPVRHPEPPAEVVVIDDSDDSDSDLEPSAKSQKVDQSSSCVICLEQGGLEDRLMTTDCCKQSVHLPCLHRYYELPVACRTKKRPGREIGKAGPTRWLCL